MQKKIDFCVQKKYRPIEKMNNTIIILQKFKKPHTTDLENKECLICLESFSIKLGEIVKLPCNCANSTYHITCVTTFLESGQNKNFCPHCKTPYVLVDSQQQPIEDAPRPEIIHYRYTYITIVHILSNTLMNVINISMVGEYEETNISSIVSKLLTVFYFCKLLVNICIMFYIKSDTEDLKSYLTMSYTIQTMLFVLLICLMSSIKNDFSSIALLMNNVFFSFTDLAFRIIIEYRNN